MEYMAPEMVQRNTYGGSVDIWSLGILLYEMMHGYAPFTGHNEPDIATKIVKHDIKFERYIRKDAKDFINTMINPIPEERPLAWELFDYEWIRRMVKEMPELRLIAEYLFFLRIVKLNRMDHGI